MRGGLLIAGAGIWLLCQVFAGNALGRLGLIGAAADTRDAAAAAVNTPATAATATPEPAA